jgi:hypothetical protein
LRLNDTEERKWPRSRGHFLFASKGPLSFPKIRSGLGSPREAETLHHPGRPDLISGRDNFTHKVGSFLGAWAGRQEGIFLYLM